MNYDSRQTIHYSAGQQPRMNLSLQSSSAFCLEGVSSVERSVRRTFHANGLVDRRMGCHLIIHKHALDSEEEH